MFMALLKTENIAAEVNRKYKMARQQRSELERDWKLNIAFYQNMQWVKFDRIGERVVPAPREEGEPRVTTNLILPVVRIELARIAGNKPAFSVTARKPDPDTVTKSKVCYDYLDFRWEADRFGDTYLKALLWAVITGTGFTKTYWDPNAGDAIELPDGTRSLGEVMVDYCSPFELVWDPFARDVDEAAWVIHARVKPLEYIEMQYGVKVNAEHTGEFFFDPTRPVKANVPSAVVKEYWEVPSPKYPKGRYAVIVQDKVIYEGDNPYADICPIPFDSVRYLLLPDSLYGVSTITYLRQINLVYNKLKTDIIRSSAKLANPPLLAPLNAFPQTPKFMPGEILYFNPYTPGSDRITWQQVGPYPPQLVNLLVRLVQEVDMISGISELGRGSVPRGVRSAAALSYLLEQEEQRASVALREYEKMIAGSLTKVLKLAKAFYSVPRMIRVVGKNGEYEAKQFKAADIPVDVQVIVEPNSTMPKSKAKLKEELLALWDRGILTDPRLVARATEYGTMEEVLVDLELDTAQAIRENERMARGEYVKVEDFHNHAVHIVEHNRFRKTEEYEKLPNNVKEVFARHVEEHKKFIPLTQPEQKKKRE